MEKIILDMTAGGRMMWFNKKNPLVLFFDKRKEERGFMRTRPNFEIKPDIQGDFKKLPFKDKSFKMVVFDPPHTIRSREIGGIIAQQYGRLTIANWEIELAQGFKEGWRVLKDDGFLVFKWNDIDKKIKLLKKFFPAQPIFGSREGNHSKTYWLVFFKPK